MLCIQNQTFLKKVLVVCTEILVFDQQISMVKYLLIMQIIISMYTLMHELLLLSFCIIIQQIEEITFAVCLSAPYLLNRRLCLFRMPPKSHVALRAYFTVRHCRNNVQHSPFDLFSSPIPLFNTSHISTYCTGCFLSNLHVGVSCGRYVPLTSTVFCNLYSIY